MADLLSPRPEHLLTLREVAEWCRLSSKAIRGAIERRELRAVKVCGRWRVAPSDLDAWLAASVVPCAPSLPDFPRPRASPAPSGSADRLTAIEREARR